MSRRHIVISSLLAIVVAGAGYAQESRSQEPTAEKSASLPADRVVMKVGDVQITEAEFEANIGDMEPEKVGGKKSIEKGLRQMGEDYASVLMLSQQAVANHLDATPEVSRQLAIGRMQILSDAQFASLKQQTKPTAEEMTQYYSAHLPDFDRVRIRRLFVWKVGAGSANTKGLAPEAARARADAVLHAAGSDANKLAEAFKDSAEGILDAEPITFRRGELPPKMDKLAFAMKEGEWGEVQDTRDGIILVQLFKRDRQTLGEVWSLIERQVQAQKMETKLNELKKNAGIWMDEQYFGPAAASTPGAQGPVSQFSQPGKSTVTQETTNENEEDVREK